MIRFVPVVNRSDFTDPSYHLPAFYELWARWGPPADRAFWAKAATASRSFFVKTTNPNTGLAPSYANFDGTPHPTRFRQSAIFGYDSWRTASNWSVDWAWWRKAPEEPQLSNRIQAFFRSRGYLLTVMCTRSMASSCNPITPRVWWPRMPWRVWPRPTRVRAIS
jgi:oligosaccharide reducing-end xylanase